MLQPGQVHSHMGMQSVHITMHMQVTSHGAYEPDYPKANYQDPTIAQKRVGIRFE